jgi:ubiquinol-cytochrome c reductase cytochrome b subunit
MIARLLRVPLLDVLSVLRVVVLVLPVLAGLLAWLAARALAAADSPSVGEPRVELWADRDTWRWRYRDDAEGVVITSNRPVLSEEDAVCAARIAYPDLDRMVVPGPPPAPPPGPVRTALRRWGRIAAAASLVVAVLVERRQRRQLPPAGRPAERQSRNDRHTADV